MVPWVHPSPRPNGISNGSATLAQLIVISNTQTDIQRPWNIGNINSVHAMQPNNNNPFNGPISKLAGCRKKHLSTSVTHTHARLTALCPGLSGWAGTRKVKPIWMLLKQETVSGSGIRWAICKPAPRSRQITTPVPHRSVFYRPDALPATQPTASKHWRHFCQVAKYTTTSLTTDPGNVFNPASLWHDLQPININRQ